MKKSIAILYDVENLVGGYNLKYLSEISFNKIMEEFHKFGLKDIAIQKAYADWGNYKLNQIKWDITDLGIEPIQIFGFAKGNMKNAADIQLVIDALEILYTKEFIDTFVIVSGDGGFSALAKRLSSYGKRVIGCSYRSTVNHIFVNVCDDFIYIENTLNKEQLNMLERVSIDENKKKSIVEHPVLKEVLPSIDSLSEYTIDEIENNIKTLMDKFWENSKAKQILRYEGLNISVFKSALNYMFVDFDFRRFGFARFSDFIRYVLRDTNFNLLLKEPSDYRILHKNYSLSMFKRIEPLYELPKIHSKNNYIDILSSKQPRILIPDNIDNFYKVVNFLLNRKHTLRELTLEEFLDKLQILGLEEKELSRYLKLLISCRILKGNSDTSVSGKVLYYFTANSKEDTFNMIVDIIRNKLLFSIDGTINESELKDIIDEFRYR